MEKFCSVSWIEGGVVKVDTIGDGINWQTIAECCSLGAGITANDVLYECLFRKVALAGVEMTNVTEDPENFITELDELCARMKEEIFNEIIQNNSFMIHILNALPVEYESVVETIEKDLASGILTIESMK